MSDRRQQAIYKLYADSAALDCYDIAELRSLVQEAQSTIARREQEIEWAKKIGSCESVFITRDGLEANGGRLPMNEHPPFRIKRYIGMEQPCAIDPEPNVSRERYREYKFHGFRHGSHFNAIAVYREVSA